jgi:hypothetical protein
MMMIVNRLEAVVVELRDCLVELVEAGEQPPAPPAVKRKEKWVGPIPEEIRRQREEKHVWHFWLSMALKRDATMRAFAARNNLTESECSRHFTRKDRCIPPGSVRDLNITRALGREITQMESQLTKVLGSSEEIAKLRDWVFQQTAFYDLHWKRNSRGAAKHRAEVRRQNSGKSLRAESC